MDSEQARRELKGLRAQIAQRNWTIAGLLVYGIVASLTVLAQIGTERTILVPPVTEKTFWVSANKVSASYLEQMAEFVAYHILDVSPANIDYKREILLRYVNPEAHGELRTRQEIEAARVKQDNVSTMFSIQQLTPDEDRMSVVLRGRLTTFVNGTRTSEDDRAYLAEFDYSGGRISLKTFKEMKHADLNQARAAAGLSAGGN